MRERSKHCPTSQLNASEWIRTLNSGIDWSKRKQPAGMDSRRVQIQGR